MHNILLRMLLAAKAKANSLAAKQQPPATMSAPRRWEDMRGCERIMEGCRKNLYLVAPALLITLLCAAAYLLDSIVLADALPAQLALRLIFITVFAFAAWQLWLSGTPGAAAPVAAAAVNSERAEAAAQAAAQELLRQEEEEKKRALARPAAAGGGKAKNPWGKKAA